MANPRRTARSRNDRTLAATLRRLGATFRSFSGRGDVVTVNVTNSRGQPDSFRVPLAQANSFNRLLKSGAVRASGTSVDK